jgi:chromosomal replication initiation ATPase DnaA
VTSRTSRQLPLDLPHAPALGRDDFLPASSNAAALAWIERWPAWQSYALALYGPAGCGKTHLASIWRARSAAVLVAPSDLAVAEPPQLLGSASACVLDLGAWEAGRSLPERALLHLMNWLAQHEGHLLLCARHAPSRWPIKLADLGSRLSAVAAVEIIAPDDALLAALLVKLLADRRLRTPADVVAYLVPRIERSCEAVGRVVAALDRASLAAQRPVTVPLAQAVLAELGAMPSQYDINITTE